MSGDSLALVRRDGSNVRQSDVFNQQGSIEWTNIANSTVTASVALLGRLASAGIEPLTLAVAQAICSGLVLGPTGERRLQESLNSLKSFSSFGDAIWFGLGVRHVLRTLVQTTQGSSCVALTASLAEVHSVDVAALVLYNFARAQKAPVELSPSFAQWKALAETCASVFKASSFGLRVQTLLSMMEKEPGLAPHSEVCDSADLAEVLHAIAMVKSGEKRSITLIGGSDCAWVIAFADWLLMLRVQLHSHNGDLLYANFDGPDHQVQISAQYAKKGSTDSKTLRKTGESYCLRSGQMILSQLGLHDSGAPDMFPSTSVLAKVQWTEALSTTFGYAIVRSMMQHGAAINSLMTEALQIFQRSHEGLRYETCGLRNPLIANVIKWFPELKPLQDLGEMDDDVKTTSTDPYRGYANSLEILAHHCECRQCTVTPSTLITDRCNLHKGRWQVCLVSLTEMIIGLCHYLAQTVTDCALYPTVIGLRQIYLFREWGYKKPESPKGSENSPEKVEEDRLRNSFYYRAFEKKHPLQQILFLLYTGDILADETTRSHISRSADRGLGRFDQVCASSWHGICCYTEVLVALSDQYCHSSRVHVTAGIIEASGRTYDIVYGSDVLASDYPAALPFDASNAGTFNDFKQWTPELKVELFVKSINVLTVTYRLFDQKGSVWVNPVSHLYKLRQAAQYLLDLHLEDVPCAVHDQSQSGYLLAGDAMDYYLVQGIGSSSGVGERRRWLYRPLLTMLSRCAALGDAIKYSHRTIIVGQKCLLCIKQAIINDQIPYPKAEMGRYEVAGTSFILGSVDCFVTANNNP